MSDKSIICVKCNGIYTSDVCDLCSSSGKTGIYTALKYALERIIILTTRVEALEDKAEPMVGRAALCPNCNDEDCRCGECTLCGHKSCICHLKETPND